MGNPVMSVKLPYRVRCNLPECQKPVNYVFKKEIDGIMTTFCSPHHVRVGEQRWEEKKKLDIRMGVPPKKDEQEMVGGNTEELIE